MGHVHHQALRAGMTRKALAHLVARHHVNHTGTRGVYRFVGVPEEPMLTSPPRLVSAIPQTLQTRAT